jgi:hypothetical protein
MDIRSIWGWVAGIVSHPFNLPTKIQKIVTRVEFGLALSCAGVAYAVGPDMGLVVPALALGWVFALVGILTAPQMTLRRGAAWSALAGAFFIAEGAFLHVHFSQENTEDLRVSFDFKFPKSKTVQVSYIFLNLGKQSALVNYVALVDLTGTIQLSDPTAYVTLCDNASPTALQMQQMMGNFIRFSIAPGVTALIRHSTEITLQDSSNKVTWPVAIESGKTKVILGSFEVPENSKDDDTRIICPLIDTRNIKNITTTAICQGASVSISLGSDARINTFQNFASSQHQILPAAPNVPTCPEPHK